MNETSLRVFMSSVASATGILEFQGAFRLANGKHKVQAYNNGIVLPL